MSATLRLVSVCAAVFIAFSTVQAREACALPVVNKQGFRPGTTVMYTVAHSPGGRPFPENRIKCVQRAFDAWTYANRVTELNVRFVWGEGGIVVRRDKPGGLALRPKAGAGWMQPVRSDDGYLEKATIWVSSDPRLVDSCLGMTKVILHELGHLHGLADTGTWDEESVMNRAEGRDDKGDKIAMTPSACDAQQAMNASLPALVATSSQ